ncbi:hypothetical protein PYW08_016773 [Mythimna loreyi]|uniref:Uncharacterized protein n=1 Tax=Mythimna loreyi TaxID=667449 RepID=A0ACC2QZ02_9NEOP|nr:hypothetical protein PYW08_016773 [Mythimna loreyi]
MDGKILATLLFLVLCPVFISAWSDREERRDTRAIDRVPRRSVHYHTKRHMLPEPDAKRRSITTPRARETRKKPSGHLTPLEEDDIDNDEVISVAIGPPPIRPKYDKVHWKHPPKTVTQNVSNATATNIVKDIIIQLGREFLTRQVSEDFIFGQYIGNAMKNLTAENKLRMQHEVLELVLKYQKLNKAADVVKTEEKTSTTTSTLLKDNKIESKKLASPTNETEDTWPDFSNLAKIVG